MAGKVMAQGACEDLTQDRRHDPTFNACFFAATVLKLIVLQ
jgi:hypothetical protein